MIERSTSIVCLSCGAEADRAANVHAQCGGPLRLRRALAVVGPHGDIDYRWRCYQHSHTPAKTFCSRCRRPLCGGCAHPILMGSLVTPEQACLDCISLMDAADNEPRGRLSIAAKRFLRRLVEDDESSGRVPAAVRRLLRRLLRQSD